MEGRVQQLWSWWKLIEDEWKEGEVEVEAEVELWGCSKVSTGRGRRLEWRDGEKSARRVRTLYVVVLYQPVVSKMTSGGVVVFTLGGANSGRLKGSTWSRDLTYKLEYFR